jgi:MFS family permease
VVGGFRRTLQGYNTLLHDRFFVGCALSSGLAGATMFAYIAGSTFVLQRIYGMSPQGFSFVFGAISLGMVGAAQGGARLALRWPLTRVLGIGLIINLLGATSLLVTVISGFPLGVLIGALVVMVCAVGLIFPTANALAMADYPDLAGTASSLQGLSQFVFGAVAAPLVGIAGEQNGGTPRDRHQHGQLVCHDELCWLSAPSGTHPTEGSLTLWLLALVDRHYYNRASRAAQAMVGYRTRNVSGPVGIGTRPDNEEISVGRLRHQYRCSVPFGELQLPARLR